MSSSESPRTKIIVSVASTLIASAIIFGASRIWPSFATWLGTAWSASWGAVTYRQPVPVWLLVLLSLGSLLFLLTLIARSFQHGPTHLDYHTDRFLGILWRWRYDSSGTVHSPIPFCPYCDMQLRGRRSAGYAVIKDIEFHCDGCNRRIAEFDFGWDELEDRVIREIHRVLRNNEWQKRLQPSAESGPRD